MESLKRQCLEGSTSGHEAEPSNSVREYSSDPLPVDLLIEIISRVPLKSIARFRCVSKIWASMLRHSDFTEWFLTKSLTRPKLLFTVKAKGKLVFYSALQPHNPDDNSCLVATPYDTSFPAYIPCDICTTVCGLVLLQGYRKRTVRVICNPATGQFFTLPKVLLKEKNLPKVKAKSNRTMIVGVYLGYDPVGKQFKVLCMTTSRDERPNTHQVLTLESGKRVWRTVEHKFHFVKNDRMRGEICIDGVLYFGASFGRSSKLVCFDFRSEKFSFINMNQGMKLVGSYVVGALALFNYNGKLGIHHRFSDSLFFEKELVLWVLEDVGNHKWSKHSYALSSLGSEIVRGIGYLFLGMTSTGEIIYSSDSCFFFYNVEKKTFSRVNIQGPEGLELLATPGIWEKVNYVENTKFT